MYRMAGAGFEILTFALKESHLTSQRLSKWDHHCVCTSMKKPRNLPRRCWQNELLTECSVCLSWIYSFCSILHILKIWHLSQEVGNLSLDIAKVDKYVNFNRWAETAQCTHPGARLESSPVTLQLQGLSLHHRTTQMSQTAGDNKHYLGSVYNSVLHWSQCKLITWMNEICVISANKTLTDWVCGSERKKKLTRKLPK